MNPRFQRTLGIIDSNTMEKLRQTHVLIAGIGGAGGQCAIDLARLGIGRLTLADFDVYEIHNSNRQIGCFDSTIGQPKVQVVSRMCADINPELEISLVPEGVTEQNAVALVEGIAGVPVDFVVEVVDLAGAKAKVWLHRACREKGVIVVTALMVGFGSALHVFHPTAPGYEMFLTSEGRVDLRKLIHKLPSYAIQEQAAACLAGKGYAPTCVVGATTASALMVTEIIRGLVLGVDQMASWPEGICVDYFDRYFQHRCNGGTA